MNKKYIMPRAMKKIVLIGDSIRMGYDKYVKDALKNTAEVFFPEEISIEDFKPVNYSKNEIGY